MTPQAGMAGVVPCAHVSSDDIWMRAGITTLLTDTGWVCGSGGATADLLHEAAHGRACALTVCHLPRELGPMMDALWSLSVLAGHGDGEARMVVLTAAPGGWVHATLSGLLQDSRARVRLTVLPETADARALLRAANGPQAGTNGWRGSFGVLTQPEVAALADLLVRRQDCREQATMKGVPDGWQRRVLQGAMRKMGVFSVRQLLFWRPERYQWRRRVLKEREG